MPEQVAYGAGEPLGYTPIITVTSEHGPRTMTHAPRDDEQNADQNTYFDAYMQYIGDPNWPERDLYRVIVCGLPRNLHAMDVATRRQVLSARPRLTGTRWDAMIAAIAEHSADRHGDPHSPWMGEPERFLRIPWMPCEIYAPSFYWEAMLFSPPAFIRHGALIHPSNLDERSGDPRWEALLET